MTKYYIGLDNEGFIIHMGETDDSSKPLYDDEVEITKGQYFYIATKTIDRDRNDNKRRWKYIDNKFVDIKTDTALCHSCQNICHMKEPLKYVRCENYRSSYADDPEPLNKDKYIEDRNTIINIFAKLKV